MFKIFRKNCCGLDVHKTWIYACIGVTDANSRTEYFQAPSRPSPRACRSCLSGLTSITAWKSAWNLPADSGFLSSTSSKKPVL